MYFRFCALRRLPTVGSMGYATISLQYCARTNPPLLSECVVLVASCCRRRRAPRLDEPFVQGHREGRVCAAPLPCWNRVTYPTNVVVRSNESRWLRRRTPPLCGCAARKLQLTGEKNVGLARIIKNPICVLIPKLEIIIIIVMHILGKRQ